SIEQIHPDEIEIDAPGTPIRQLSETMRKLVDLVEDRVLEMLVDQVLDLRRMLAREDVDRDPVTVVLVDLEHVVMRIRALAQDAADRRPFEHSVAFQRHGSCLPLVAK